MHQRLEFRFTHMRGRAVQLHSRHLDHCTVPSWDRLSVTRPTVVVGSAQRLDVVSQSRAAGAEVDVVVRNSGGGAVWLDPIDSHWIDVTIASNDPRWQSDIGLAFAWLGDVFVAALRDIGVNATAHRGKAAHSDWSRLVCFGGVGSGEILVDGRKFVGMSQRRTRDRARFQLVFYGRFDPIPLADLLDLEPAERMGLRAHLESSVVGCDALGLDPEALHVALGGARSEISTL